MTLCRLLQRNPRFYYRKRHFVSVSSLVYRMKRNGAGLASICILGTMVLVMLSSTTCLYFGAEDSLRTRYPRAENVTVWYTDREDLYRDHSDLHAAVVTAARSRGAQMQDLREYRSSSSALTVRNGVLQGAGGSISQDVYKRQPSPVLRVTCALPRTWSGTPPTPGRPRWAWRCTRRPADRPRTYGPSGCRSRPPWRRPPRRRPAPCRR